MELLSFGDRINEGNYILHSSFDKVHNYYLRQDLVSIVNHKIGDGPNNIVVKLLPKKSLFIHISSNFLEINSIKFPRILSKSTIIEKKYFITNFSVLQERINWLISTSKLQFSTKSLAFVIFPENKSHFISTFEKNLCKYVSRLTNKFSLNKLPEIAKKMRGIGFGLTPSGDDFNTGVLYALNYLENAGFSGFPDLKSECYKNSLGKNLISNTFLKFAYKDHYYEDFRNFIIAMNSDDKVMMNVYLKKILGAGHTSGSDMLTGFIYTMKGVLYDKKLN
ncbi:MAG: DUF2877 domain-containing protein [Candidatus Cloacimonetes bacterium]|nr:DUF2877 domain-containing protein [Candidatus Cloacimonadota bacterium]